MHSEIEEYLGALRRDACYSVEKILKSSAYETTEMVYFVGENGAKQGPMIRKRFASAASGAPNLGKAYECIWKAQREGRRFLHIPRIVECYSTEDSRIVVMEYVSGETLSDLIYRRDPSSQLAIEIFPGICASVMELHECFEPPIIHRDLKPSNIMISRGGMVTLIDFGIARPFVESADTDTYHFGTRSYAPPEQFGFGQTNVRSDVYALGMLLYYCLTERNPSPSMAGKGFEDAPAPFRPILAKATAFDPKDRFASARELNDEFHRVVALLSEREAAAGAEERMPSDSNLGGSQSKGSDPRKGNRVPRRPNIPIWIGVVWNLLVLSVWALFIAAGVSATTNPIGEIQSLPFMARAVMYFGLVVCCCGSIAFAISDKRLIRKAFAGRVPALAQASFKQVLLFCLAVFIVGVILMFLPAIANTILRA